MISVSTIPKEKQARNVAFAGLGIQIILAATLLFLSRMTGSWSAFFISMSAFAGVLMWVPMIIIYEQRRRVAREALETEQLRSERQDMASGALFDLEGEEYLVQQRRLRWMYRWLLSFFVMVTIGILLICWYLALPVLGQHVVTGVVWASIRLSKVAMGVGVGVAFVAYLFSRYTAAMAREHDWRMLRAGAVYLFGIALMCLAMSVALAVYDSYPIAERVLAQAVGWILLVLGLEFGVNFILDFYRPRAATQEIRTAFESRLLGLVSEPGDMARSIADAVNYQFGFEVSATWFYKTLQQNVVRMAAVSVIILVGMSSMVIIDADEMGIKERWGRMVGEPLGPGLYFKMPWPAEIVYKENVQRVQEMYIGGSVGEDEPMVGEDHGVITWTEEHDYIASTDLIVATPELARLTDIADDDDRGADVAVSILRVSMPVHYRVRPDAIVDYFYNYYAAEDGYVAGRLVQGPMAMLRDIAQRELVKQAVHFDYQRIMADQREVVARSLQEAIQAKCDEMKLGLEIVFVGLQEIHPPTEDQVAATFQKVATAGQLKDALIQTAHIEYAKTLIEAAGDVGRAEAIDEISRRKSHPDLSAAERALIDEELRSFVLGDPEAGILPIRGTAGEALAMARADALNKVSDAAAKAATFDLEMVAYTASPELYMTRKLLQTVSSELDDVRKYVLAVDHETTEIIVEVDERQVSGLEILDQEQN